MNRSEILSKVKKIVENKSGAEDVTEVTTLRDDLSFDSLDMSELHMDVESEFNVSIRAVDFEKVHTVGELIDCVCRELSDALK